MNSLAQETILDPFKLWKAMYDKAETNFNEIVNEIIHKEAFAEWLGQVQLGYLQYQELIQNTTDTYLKQINVPTREEISNIASLVINVEEKVETLQEKIEDEILDKDKSVSAEIAKLKTNISKLDKKMDQILNYFKQMEEAANKAQAPSGAQK